MIYVQLRARVKLAQGETLHVADAAKVLGSEKAGHCSLFCPTSPGVYTLDAIAVAKALKKVFPQEDISLIGVGEWFKAASAPIPITTISVDIPRKIEVVMQIWKQFVNEKTFSCSAVRLVGSLCERKSVKRF